MARTRKIVVDYPSESATDSASEYVDSSDEQADEHVDKQTDDESDEEIAITDSDEETDSGVDQEVDSSNSNEDIELSPPLLDVAEVPRVDHLTRHSDQDLLDIEDEIQTFEEENHTRRLHAGNPRENRGPGSTARTVVDSDVGSDEEALYDGNKAPPEFYRQNIEGLQVKDFKRKHYAKGTLLQIKNCERYWQTFCLGVLHRPDWQQCLEEADFSVIYNFLWWYLNQTKSPSGRAKRPVKRRGTLVTFWCNFRLFYERIVTEKVDTALPSGGVMNNALITLGQKFNLSVDRRENRPMTLRDLHDHIEVILLTTQMNFKLGELRILAALFLLLLAPQGSRPQSILNIRFEHIDIVLIRDPEDPTGPPRLTIRLRLEETKTYRGRKDVKTFIVPEILYDPSLYLSPHIFLLAILFHHRAFQSEILNNNPSMLSTLRVQAKANELRLAFKDDIKKLPLFRRSVKTTAGYEMSATPLTQSTTGSWIKSAGKLLGFEHKTITYGLRYFAGNSLDQSVNISASLKNFILDHAPNSDTFQKNYLSRFVCADLWAVHRETNPQAAVIKQTNSHGGSRDARRRYVLSEAHVAAVKRDRQYVRLTRKLERCKLPKTSPARKAITRDRKNLLVKLKARKLQEVMKLWTESRALQDIAEQAPGVEPSQVEPELEPPGPPMSEAKQRMADALNEPLINDLQAQFRRRDAAIRALVAYCAEEEPISSNLLEKIKPPPSVVLKLSMPPEAQLEEIKNSVFVSVMGDQVRRCFLCVWKAGMLGMGHYRFPQLCRPFYDGRGLARHFTTVHLDQHADSQQFECPNCQESLFDKMHLRRHADDVHGICTAQKQMRYT